jgi:hypothetical protein
MAWVLGEAAGQLPSHQGPGLLSFIGVFQYLDQNLQIIANSTNLTLVGSASIYVTGACYGSIAGNAITTTGGSGLELITTASCFIAVKSNAFQGYQIGVHVNKSGTPPSVAGSIPALSI